MEIEKECALLGNLFQHIVTDLKSSSPAWEDFVNKGTKLHSLLKSTTVVLSSFTESIQKIADIATNTKGATKDVGCALTRICVRQKMVENKLKHFTSTLLDNLISPVHEKLEEWKKVASQLEKDHSKDYKKATQEIKKKNSDTLRLQKKARKGSKPDLHQQLSSVLYDVNERFAVLEETEKSALRNLLVEERSRVCLFANCLSPVLESQVSILNEASHLHDLSAEMSKLCRNPMQLPTSTEQLVQDYISAHTNHSPTTQDNHSSGFSDFSGKFSPPSSPTSGGSRKSSLCSLNSLASSDSRSSGSLNRASSFHQRHYQGQHKRSGSGVTLPNGLGSPTSCKSVPVYGAARLSVSSHDSGFVSTGNGTLPPPHHTDPNNRQPLFPSGQKNEQLPEDTSDGPSPVIRGRSQSQQLAGTIAPSSNPNRFSWKDWSKPGPYDIQISGSSKNEASSVLPNKINLPPPLISPKPTSQGHRHSMDDAAPHHPPLHRSNTIHEIHSPVSQREDALPPPPSLDETFTPSTVDDTLPPPPPEFFEESIPSNDVTPTAGAPTDHHVLSVYAPVNVGYPTMSLNRKSSVGSLQYSTSSGYSSQHTTPTCSEDTIASHDAGSIENYDNTGANGVYRIEQTYSTVPRNYHHRNRTNSLPRSSFHKRRASTNGLPSSEMTNGEDAHATATIRRKPSCKLNSVRRTASGPKPVAPPTVPVHYSSFSTFAPAYYANDNNNNNNQSASRGREPTRHYTQPESTKVITDPTTMNSTSRDMTLRFRGSGDCHGGDSPTPTTTPVSGEATLPFYASHTSHSNAGRK